MLNCILNTLMKEIKEDVCHCPLRDRERIIEVFFGLSFLPCKMKVLASV